MFFLSLIKRFIVGGLGLGKPGRAALSACLFAAGLSLGGTMARAQDALSDGSYVTPFPSGDVYQLMVIGDSLADGLHWTVRDTLSVDARVTVNRQRWALSSLLSSKFFRNLKALRRDLKNNRVDIALVMLGSRDQKSAYDRSGQRHRVGTAGWREVLSQRVDQMMRMLKDLNIAVYWVGLPTLRKGQANEMAQVINEVIRERAYLQGLKYIDIFTSFADDSGGYSAYGPDLTGKIRLLRERDGVHFTRQGNRKLAHFVERELKRDLKLAKAERSIPLAGSPKEQARVLRKQKTKTTKTSPADWRTAISATAKSELPLEEGTIGGFFSGSSGGEQKEDNGKITLRTFDNTGREEAVTMELVRPPIPASVVALVTRKQSSDRLSTIGDTVVDQIAGGFSIMSSVTPVHEAWGGGGRSRLSPAQTPFFRVLVKGERTIAKPGRADDFAWPRPEPPPLPKPVKLVPRKKDADDGGIPLPPISPFRERA